ncbi:MAG: tetratricopeptide repeat protein [Melioribacteraceae bacterium]|nr:tetratricopeptide repeat protein [Melioribacteraceae bacterium]
MKRQLLFFTLMIGFAFNIILKAQNDQVTFSLFYEYHKNKDFVSAIDYGWQVVNGDPSPWLRYKIFPKMEEILWYLHDSSKVTDQGKTAIKDTMMYFYDRAIKYEPNLEGYYTARKAYVKEVWIKSSPLEIVPLYEHAISKDPYLDNFYKDRLGVLYVANASDENGYKLKALDLYSNLAEAEPDNPLWNQKLETIAENIDELVAITKKSWEFDKENLEKAWKYASTCMRAQDYEQARIPLEFLTANAPEVINYWKQLASVYEKLDLNDKAINAYKKLIELQPDNRDNLFNLALVYKRIEQLSVSRTYLQRAMKVDPNWDYPVFIEAQLYEQGARACEFDFMAKCVYLLAVNSYRKAASMGGQFSSTSSERVKALQNSVPTKEDYFFRKLKSGDVIKIEGPCYSWIDRSVSVP